MKATKKVEKSKVTFLFAKYMRIHAERKSRVGMTELRRDPANALPRRQCEARKGMASIVNS
jgi:hypothetical protein